MSSLYPLAGETQEQCDARLRFEIDVVQRVYRNDPNLFNFLNWLADDALNYASLQARREPTAHPIPTVEDIAGYTEEMDDCVKNSVVTSLELQYRSDTKQYTQLISADLVPSLFCVFESREVQFVPCYRLECTHMFTRKGFGRWLHHLMVNNGGQPVPTVICPVCRKECAALHISNQGPWIPRDAAIYPEYERLVSRLYPNLPV
jgi:hypothetical protein